MCLGPYDLVQCHLTVLYFGSMEGGRLKWKLPSDSKTRNDEMPSPTGGYVHGR